MHTCLETPRRRWFGRSLAIGLLALLYAAAPSWPTAAQEIVLSANGDPITTVDIDQRMKLLRALHKPATREAATESMIEDRLKARDASRYGVNLKDDEIGEEVLDVAKRQKVSPPVLMQNLARAGVSQDHARSYFKSQFAFALLIRGLNRGVDASEVAVRGELAKEKTKGSLTRYSLRQIVFTVNPGDPPAVFEASAKQAQALRTRFTSCASGLPYAKSLPGVAIREKLTRSSSELSDQIKEILDKTPIGHLTEPTRSPNGIELVAVCDRTASTDDEELRKTISLRLLAQHYAQAEAERYKDIRSHAVISRSP